MSEHGGKREGAGRKAIADEDKAKELIHKSLKLIYKKDGDDENTVLFLKEFALTPRGQQFIAEHIIGKPKDKIEHNIDSLNIPILKWANDKE